MVVNCRPIASDAMFDVIDSGGIVTDDIAVNDVVVSAEILDSRNGGGCLPVSKELALDSTSLLTTVPSLFLVDVRFRFPLLSKSSVGLAVVDSVTLDFGDVAVSVGLDLAADFVCTLVSRGGVGES
jgi:hypothetical protein